MANEYDGLFTAEEKRLGGNAYNELFKPSEPLTVRGAVSTTPEQFNTAVGHSRAAGVPLPVVRRNPEEAGLLAREALTNKVLEQYPTLGPILLRDENAANTLLQDAAALGPLTENPLFKKKPTAADFPIGPKQSFLEASKKLLDAEQQRQQGIMGRLEREAKIWDDIALEEESDLFRAAESLVAGAETATLGLAESIWRTPDTLARIAEYVAQTVEKTGLPWYLNPVRGVEDIFDFVAEGRVPGMREKLGGTTLWAEKIQRAQQLIVQNPEVFGDVYKRLNMKSQIADQALKQALEGDSTGLFKILGDPEAWAGFIGNAAPSLYAAYVSGGSLPFIAWMEAMQASGSAAEFEKRTGQKIDPALFTQAVLQAGTINAVLERTGLNAILKSRGGGLVGAIKGTLMGGGGEMSTEMAQQLNSNLAAFLSYNPKQDLTEGVLASGMGGFGSGAVPGAVQGSVYQDTTNVIAEHQAKMKQAEDAAGYAKHLSEAGLTLSQTKAISLAPAGMEELAKAVQGLDPDGVVVIDAKIFGDVLEQTNVPLGEVIKVAGSLRDQYINARAMKSDLVIPTGEFLAGLAATPAFPMLVEHVKPSTDTMSQAEATVFMQDQAAILEKSIAAVIEKHAGEAEFKASSQRVFDRVFAALGSADRFTADVNRVYASQMANFFTTLADKLGVTPEEAMARHDVGVVAESLLNDQRFDQFEPASEEDFKPGKIGNILKRGRWTILEAGNPMGQVDTPENNAAAMTRLKAQLDAKGIKYLDTIGSYGAISPSLLVFGVSQAEAAELGNQFGQESVLTRRGLIYNDGTLNPATGTVEEFTPGPDDDYYTTIPSLGVSFRVGIDFDQRNPLDDDALDQSASIRRGVETLKKYGLAPGKRYTVREVAAALEARQRAKYGAIDSKDTSPEAVKKIAKWMVEEVLFEMENPGMSGVGWYSDKFQRALDNFGALFPELLTDQDARDVFTLIIAVTSDGAKVMSNAAMAIGIYSNYRESGKIAFRAGAHNRDIETNLATVQELLDTYGPSGARDFLLQEKTVKELKALAKERGAKFNTAYSVDTLLPMSAVVLGPKLGAFYANLMGRHGYLTMDRWWSRTFNRYRGTLVSAPTQQSLDRFRELTNQPGLSNDEVIAAVVPIRDGYKAKGYKNGTELEKMANNIYKFAFESLNDKPFRSSDRSFMIASALEAQKMLKRKGHEVSIADLQAILWYYEKKLYGELGIREPGGISYEEAAKILVQAAESDPTGGSAAQRAARVAAVNVDPGSDIFAEGGTLNQAAIPRVDNVVGVHFSQEPRTSLDGRRYGTGAKGAEHRRVMAASDTRLRERVHFYVSSGNGVRPESDVGGAAHISTLDNLYDADVDAQGFFRGASSDSQLNAAETAVIDAGYDGYLKRSSFSDQGTAVILGPASRTVDTEHVGGRTEANAQATVPVAPQYSSGQLAAQRLMALKNTLPAGAMEPQAWRGMLAKVSPSTLAEIDAYGALDNLEGPVYLDAIARGFYSQNEENPRGQIRFGKDITKEKTFISLLRRADLSTFLHESAHFYFEVYRSVATELQARKDAGETLTAGEQSIIDDMNVLLDYIGVKPGQSPAGSNQTGTLAQTANTPKERAKAQGFDVKDTLYHWRSREMVGFKPFSHVGTQQAADDRYMMPAGNGQSGLELMMRHEHGLPPDGAVYPVWINKHKVLRLKEDTGQHDVFNMAWSIGRALKDPHLLDNLLDKAVRGMSESQLMDWAEEAGYDYLAGEDEGFDVRDYRDVIKYDYTPGTGQSRGTDGSMQDGGVLAKHVNRVDLEGALLGYLSDRGITALSYVNDVEDAGSISYIIPDQRNVRSIHAKFEGTGQFDMLDQTVWHGTPNIWAPEPGFPHGRPRLDKMGTGEGVQAFGWGWYSAESRGVGKSYAINLARTTRSFKGAELPTFISDESHVLAKIALDETGTTRYLLPTLNDALFALSELTDEQIQERVDNDDFQPTAKKAAKLALRLLAEGVTSRKESSLYQLDIPDDVLPYLLDWNKPLSEQTKEVRDAINTVAAWKLSDDSMAMSYNGKTGRDFYEALVALQGSKKSASNVLARLGIVGNRYLDGQSRNRPLKNIKREFLAELPEDADFSEVSDMLGAGRFSPNNEALIKALRDNDWLGFDYPAQAISAALSKDLGNYDVSPALKQAVEDAQEGATYNFVIWDQPTLDKIALLERNGEKLDAIQELDQGGEQGTPGGTAPGATALQVWNNMTFEQRRAGHELVARAFEAYFYEGKAPTVELQGVFSRMKSWLMAVYKDIKAYLGAELTDGVRGVFDRMLATQDRIQATEAVRAYAPLFASAEQMGVTPEEWVEYQKTVAAGTESAEESLLARSLRDMRWTTNARAKALKGLRKDAAVKRRAIRAEVEQEVWQEPVYAAMRFLRSGILPEGDQVTGAKLDLAALKAMYGEDANAPWRYLSTGPNGLAGNEGLHPDVVAEMFGIDSGDALVRALLAANSMESEIEGRTDQRMLERYGELADEASMQRAADEAVHNEARGKFVATELNALAKLIGKPKILAKAAKEFAASIINRKRVRDIRPAQFEVAETRAAKASMDALKAGNLIEAATEKRNQLVNFYAAKAAHEALRYHERALRYLKKFANKGTRKGLDPAYLEQIDGILADLDLRKLTQREMDSRTSLSAWIKAQEAAGHEPIVDEELLERVARKPFQELTIEELQGVVDSVKNIEHLGRLKKKLLTARDRREFREKADMVAASIRENANRTVKQDIEFNSPTQWAKDLWRGFLAIHRKFASRAREMDGGKDGGLVWETLIWPMNDAGNMETNLREQASVKLAALFKPIMGRHGWTTKMQVPGTNFSLSREGRIMLVLNWGTESSRQRVKEGGLDGKNALTDADMQAIINTLTKEEMDFVQGVWDLVGSFKGQIAAQERRLTGVEPKWLEPVPVETPHGVYPGGYFPAKYEGRQSTRSAALEAATDLRQAMAGLFGRASARNSYTKERAKGASGRPLRKDFGVISQHLNEVIHRLSWQDWLTDATRLINDRAIEDAIREHYGNEVVHDIRETVFDLARGDLPPQGPIDTTLRWLRHGTSIAGMGWNVVTALLQPSGLTQSAERIGGAWLARGIAEYTAHPVKKIEEVFAKSSMMRLRAKTMQREINEVLNTIKEGEAHASLKASYFWTIAKMQLQVDMPTWLGAYQKAASELGMEGAPDQATRDALEEHAVALADQAVLDSQGGGQLKDLAAVQRGPESQKLFTNFYSFFNTTYNLSAEAKNTKSAWQLPGSMMLLFAIPIMYTVALKELLKGECDLDPECLAKRLGQEGLSYMLGTMVLVRELSSAFQGYHGYTGPAGTRFFSEVGNLIKQGTQGEVDIPAVKAAVMTVAIPLHLPGTAINRLIEGSVALEEGDTDNILAPFVGVPRK